MTQTIKSTIGVLSRLRQGQRMNGVANRGIQGAVKSINDYDFSKRELRHRRSLDSKLVPVAMAHTQHSACDHCLNFTYPGSR